MSERNWSPEVARVLHEFGEAAPLPPSPDTLRNRTPPRSRPRRAVSVAAAVLVLAGAAGTWAALGRDGAVSPAGDGRLEVHHATYEVSITGTLDCATPIDTAGTFDTAAVETWADRSGRQWRSQITYPDGSTFDSIYQGSALYPAAAFERGVLRQQRLGCVNEAGEEFTLAALSSPFFSLTILDEIAPDERPYVMDFTDHATLVDSGVADSRGRPSDEWQQLINGSAGYGTTANLPLRQVTTWWVAPDGTVTEHRYNNTVESLGTATTTETLVSDETITADPEVFSTNGYTAFGGSERPDAPSGGPNSTVRLAASPYDSGASMIVYVRPGASAEQVELIRTAIAQNAPVAGAGLRYLDAQASLTEAQRVYADVPAMLGRLDTTTVPTMFQLFPTGELTPDLAQAFMWMPNVIGVTTPDSLGSNDIPLTLPTDNPRPTLAPSTDCPGDDLDLTSEPTGWRQGAVGTWYRADCVVRIDVITDRPGPAHCGWEHTRVLAFGTPLGTPFTNSGDDVQYVRDPSNAYGYGFDATFEAEATLPPDAVFSGYSTDTEQLWTVPGDDAFIYLVLSDRTERWPKGDPPGCD